MNIEFSQHVKNKHMSNFMKIRPVEVESFHEDRQTCGHGEPNTSFSQLC